jgi:hypothetical protein
MQSLHDDTTTSMGGCHERCGGRPWFGNNCIDVGDYDWMGVFDQAMFNDDVGGGIQGDTPLEVAAAAGVVTMAIYLSMQPDATIK